MLDQDLDKIAEKWAEEEAASAPKMRPTAEMYERVAALGRKGPLGTLFARRPAWATAAAVVLVCVLAFAAVQLAPLAVPGGGQQLAYVPQRDAFVPEKAEPRATPPPKGKGPVRGASPFLQLVLQIVGPDATAMRSVDVMAAYTGPVALTAEESYRLVLEPAAVRYVYVYQKMPGGEIACLYPNQAYHPQPNPMQAAEKVYLPAEPNGLYIEGTGGLSRLYVVAAEKPLPELEAPCAQCRQWGICLNRRKRLADLQRQLDVLVGGQVEGVRGWMLEFEVR